MTAVDVLGRPRTAVNEPGARKGQKPSNAGRRFPGEVLTPQEIRRLLDSAQNNGYAPAVGERNRALIVVLWRCGLRLSEALNLAPRDINLVTRQITVTKSKTRTGLRTVGVDDMAAESLERWLVTRTGLGVHDDAAPVFCTVIHGRGRPMAPSTWQGTIKEIAQRAGIEKRVHSHGLRHTFATEMVNAGIKLPAISKALGHSSVAITCSYLETLIDRDEAIKAMQQRSVAVEPQLDPLQMQWALEALQAATIALRARGGDAQADPQALINAAWPQNGRDDE